MTSKYAIEQERDEYRRLLLRSQREHEATKAKLADAAKAQRELLTAVLELLSLSDAYPDITTEVEIPDTVYVGDGYRLPMGTKKVKRTDKGVDRFRDDLLAAKDALHGEAALKKIRTAMKENKK